MNLKQTKMRILHESEDLSKKAKTGVSLHCHTEHSKEMLDFIPHYAEKLPIIAFFWKRERDNYIAREGRTIDFSTAYWSPPLSSSQVYDIEKSQINQSGLEAIVSLTDHDSIDANLEVNKTAENSKAPISLEWTVPFEFGFFHVGVHNLPKDRADEITQTLLAYTFDEGEPDNEKLHELFAMLNEMREVLIILNHPIWDIEIVGQKKHDILLKRFLKEYGKWIHALEVNGFRSWSENKAVIELAEALNFPVATGGDRHGCKPNTVINLTDSNTFAEFVEEIRVDKKSEIVLMPEYRRPLHSRQLQGFSEILSHYPEFPEERRLWFQRVFFDIGDGKGLVPLSDHGWRLGGPRWLRVAVKTLGFMGSPAMRPVFKIVEKKKDRVPKNIKRAGFKDPDLKEIPTPLSNSQTSAGSAS
ncbi:MAG: hypothetical protein HKN25_08490 [Pyrinomonadaceae bacterium]|nr:hypothetical protein [Pyrinomonadaceae bacterium]